MSRLKAALHDAVDDDELIGRRAELGGRHLDQHAARFGRGHAHLLAAELDAGRAGGAALVHAGGGVAHVDLDGLERHVELLRHDLADGDEQPVAHVHLAEEGRDGAVGVDGDVGGELVGRQRRLRALRERIVDAEQHVEADRRADRNDERAGAHQHRAAGQRRGLFHLGHDALPQPIIAAARLTALRMLTCVPQRHLRPSRALFDLGLGRLLLGREERGGRHDPAVDAVAALRHLLLDVGGLQRMRLLRRAEAGQRHDLGVADATTSA